MPRALPFEIYNWPRRKLNPSFLEQPSTDYESCRRVNWFVCAALPRSTYIHLHRFAERVYHSYIYSPALFVALYIGARLFGTDDDARLCALLPLSPSTAQRRRTLDDVSVYNSAYELCSEELLEFLRAPVDVMQRAAEQHSALVDLTSVQAFCGSSGNNSGNTAYRVGMFLVALRTATATLGERHWTDLVLRLRWSGVVQQRVLESLQARFAKAKCLDDNELRSLFAMFALSKTRFGTLVRKE